MTYLKNTIPTALVLLLLSLWACQQPNSDRYVEAEQPDKLIEKEEFTEILLRLHLSESEIAHSQLPQDTATLLFIHIRDSIWADYQVDSGVFFENFNYYCTQPHTMYTIYNTLTDSLSLMQSRYRMEQEKNNQKEDE